MRFLFVALFFLPGLAPQLQAQSLSSTETGYASYYANYLDGRKTAYGEIYNKNKLTAAHRTYPLGTLLRVSRQDNGKSVIVRVNDKGPVDQSRAVDVSYAAAEMLDLIYDGIAMVEVQVVDENGNPIPPPAPIQAQPKAPVAYDRVEVPVSYDYKPQFKQPETTAAKSAIPGSSLAPAETAPSPYQQDLQPKTPLPSTQPAAYGPAGGDRISAAPAATGYFVQIGAFSKRANAENLRSQLSAKGFHNAQVQSSDALFKTLVGPFNDEATAKREQQQLNQAMKVKGFVTKID